MSVGEGPVADHYQAMSTMVVMAEITEPAEIAAARRQRERFDRNFAPSDTRRW